MSLVNCPVCGKLFNRGSRALCLPCWDREQVLYEQVSRYVYSNPEADASEVVAKTGVSREDLEYLIKRGRLLGFARLVATVISCRHCGEAIERGTYCKACVGALKGVVVEEEAESSGKPVSTPAPQGGRETIGFGARGAMPSTRSDYWRDRAQR
ncbi:MAG: hypothetical protein KGR26_10945 [Cyanobacteria bacterium REEB65]|nr:hypothetical protein [Cyanobacteria bacterium REEB65]